MEAAAGSCQQAAVAVRAALPSLPSAPPPLAPLLWALLAFLVAAGLGVAIAGRCRRHSVAADASHFWRLCSRGSTVLALAPRGDLVCRHSAAEPSAVQLLARSAGVTECIYVQLWVRHAVGRALVTPLYMPTVTSLKRWTKSLERDCCLAESGGLQALELPSPHPANAPPEQRVAPLPPLGLPAPGSVNKRHWAAAAASFPGMDASLSNASHEAAWTLPK